jgi:hypothetical protein
MRLDLCFCWLRVTPPVMRLLFSEGMRPREKQRVLRMNSVIL